MNPPAPQPDEDEYADAPPLRVPFTVAVTAVFVGLAALVPFGTALGLTGVGSFGDRELGELFALAGLCTGLIVLSRERDGR